MGGLCREASGIGVAADADSPERSCPLNLPIPFPGRTRRVGEQVGSDSEAQRHRLLALG